MLGLTLATNANASFKKALANRRAPDIVVMIDGSKVTSAELARTRRLKGVTQAAGPYPATTIKLASASGRRCRARVAAADGGRAREGRPTR